MTAQYRYRFGHVVFDESTLELIVGGLPVDVQPRTLKILSLLLARGGKIVSREELFDTIWRGRRTVENVLANQITKLRNALGEEYGALIENVPRVGYRFAGTFERTAVARILESRLQLKPGDAVPQRPGFSLERLLSQSGGQEVWLARGATGRRVYKFASDAQRLSSLKREVTVGRLLRDELGERADIVAIIDWNFDSTPYFVESEFGGEHLLNWGEQDGRLSALPVAGRLDLLLQIGSALAAAHGVGVLHKDLKPQNILIMDGNAGPQVRLVDFGSAKLLEPERLQRLGITSMGMTVADGVGLDQARGTLLYMAPELFDEQAASVRTDVYALGVIGYQLLAGDLRRPVTAGWGADVDELLREDIARAIDLHPDRRFASVEEFLDSVRKLEARREQLVLQREMQLRTQRADEALRRTRARRPWVIATISSLALGLLISVGLFIGVLSARAGQQREYTAAQALNDFLTRDFIALADPFVTGRKDVTVIEAARAAADRIDTTFRDVDPAVRGRLHAALQQSLDGLSDFGPALREGQRALDASTQSGADAAQIAAVRITMAAELGPLSRSDEADAQLQAAWALITKEHLEHSTLAARYHAARAGVAQDSLALPAALSEYQAAWEIAGTDPLLAPDIRDKIEFRYADTLKMSGRFDDAEARTTDLLSREEQRLGPKHPAVCFTRSSLASINGYQHKFDVAIPMAKTAVDCMTEALGEENLRTVSANEVLAALYFQTDQYALAAQRYQQIVKSNAALTGPDSVRTLTSRVSLGMAKQYSGDAAGGCQEFNTALASAKATLAWNHPSVEGIRYHLADCRLDQRSTSGVDLLLADLTPDVLYRAQMAPDWEGRLAYQSGRLALYTGDNRRAIPLLERAADIIAAKNPDGIISEAAVRVLIQKAQTSHGRPTRQPASRSING